MLVGKEVAFTITHSLPANGGPGGVNLFETMTLAKWLTSKDREFATIYIAPASPGGPPQDVSMLIVSAGWAKVRDGVGEGDEAVR